MHTLKFRSATDDDGAAIVSIHNAHALDLNALHPEGFLLAKTSEAEFLKNLSHQGQYFVTTDSDDQILGFVALARPTITLEFLDEISWADPTCIPKITSDRHIYIQILAIKTGCMGQGIAQFMYHSLYQTFPTACFSAFIVNQPRRNDRSLNFHQKQGFCPVGMLQRSQFLGLTPYESILVFKDSIQTEN